MDKADCGLINLIRLAKDAPEAAIQGREKSAKLDDFTVKAITGIDEHIIEIRRFVTGHSRA